MNPRLSIIIPVYKESARIGATLHAILDLNIPIPFEIIVSDGESPPSTRTLLKADKTICLRHPVKGISSPRGRGVQLNAGAKAARGDLFFFLHADTRIDQKGMDLMIDAWRNHSPPFFCGAFDLRIDSKRKVFRLIERVASVRSRITKLPYGDQGIFISRQLFEKINGFPNVSLMEDVGIMMKIKRKKVTPVFLPHTICTSARRWKNQGILFTTLRNWVLISLYLLGVPPRVLTRYY